MNTRFTTKSLGVAVVLGAFSISATAHAGGHGITPQEKKLIPGAKAEGSVTLINPLFSDRTSKRIGAAFKKKYGLGDGFKVNMLRKGTGATVAQVRQEIKAGKFTVDAILVSAPPFFDAGAKRGAFLELDSAHWKDSAGLAKAAGQYSKYPYVVTPLAYTFQPVWNKTCPGMANFDVKSYADTTKAMLKGNTLSSDITKSFTYSNTVVALEKAGAVDFKKFWAEKKKTDPLVEFRTEPKIQMVISCQRPFDMWNLSGRVYQNVIKQPALKDKLVIGSYKEGQVMLGNQIAVLKGAKNPNAGKLLVEFLLTKEGSDLFVEGEAIYSFRKGYKAPAAAAPYLMDLSKHKLIGLDDWVGAAKSFKSVRAEWAKNYR